MKTDDIFEALTDIDDKLIEKAYPLMDDPQAPVYVLPAERTKPRRKTIAAVAACAAGAVCVAALGTIGVNYLREKGIITSSPAASGAERYYPENAKYTVSEKITNDTANLSWAYTTNGAHFERWDDESTYAANYDELAAKSDLIVAGQFVDLPHQTQDPDKTHVSSHAHVMIGENWEVTDYTEEGSYDNDAFMMNYFQVERVFKSFVNTEDVPLWTNTLKGTVEEGDEIPICQETSINLGGSGTHIVFAYDRLTPMLKGDEWIYFLKKIDDGYYVPVNGAQGRYPMPNNKNVDLTAGGVDGIDEFGTYKNAAPAREEIYDRLKKLLSGADQNIQSISLPEDGSETEFLMTEFPEYSFKATSSNVAVNFVPDPEYAEISSTGFSAIGAWNIENLYLADLNSDGKREICATIRVGNTGVTAIRVCDLANGVEYFLKHNNADEVYTLAEEGGRLMAVTREYLPLYYSRNPEERSREPLTLEMMSAVKPDTEEINLSGVTDDKTLSFLVPEFQYDWFTVSKTSINIRTKFGSTQEEPATPISADEIQKLFLCDINGDGLREICAQVDVGGKIGVRVLDIAENASYSLFDDEVDCYGLSVWSDGSLLINTCRKDVSTGELQISGGYQLAPYHLVKDSDRPRVYNIGEIPRGALIPLEEYPEFALRPNSYTVYLLDKDTERLRQVIIGDSKLSNYIYNLYLADLNGDGSPEVCAVLENYTGGLNKKIEIFDIAHNERYISYTPDHSEGDMKFEVKDDVLYAVITNAGQELYREPLSLELDIIKPLSDFIEDH